MNEEGFSPREKLTRFDSINSSKDFGHSRAFSSFDDGDPFGSSAPFKVSSEDQTPKKSSGNWSSFYQQSGSPPPLSLHFFLRLPIFVCAV
jgi:hypothetical protein